MDAMQIQCCGNYNKKKFKFLIILIFEYSRDVASNML